MRQEYTAELKEQAVKRVKDGKRVSAVAKEMGPFEQTLRNRVKAFDVGTLKGAGAANAPPEAMELSRLRAENARLKREVDIFKQATASFARDAHPCPWKTKNRGKLTSQRDWILINGNNLRTRLARFLDRKTLHV